MAHLTKKGALSITSDIDRIAAVVVAEFQALGIPEKVAKDFEHRCDKLSDRIERTAGIDPEDEDEKKSAKKADFDAKEIGEETSGPLEGEGDEPYMKGEFDQQENRELREDQESGKLPSVNTEPRSPRPGVQASLTNLGNSLKGVKLSAGMEERVASALILAAQVIKDAKKKADDEEEGAEEEVEAGKKASHDYNLSA